MRSVLVVGGGPAGLACALALRAHDLDVTVLESRPAAAARAGSRAIYVHRTSLELLERIRPSLGEELAQRGLVWPAKRTLWCGREVFARHYPSAAPGGLPPFTSLPQTLVEDSLARACASAGVELIQGAEVTSLQVGEETIEARDGAGGRWRARHLVAADGARSMIRSELGIEMEGRRSENAFIVADVSEDPREPMPPARIFHYRHPGVGGRNVLLVPFAGGWRADLQCRVGDDLNELSSGEGVSGWIAEVLGARYGDRVEWVSTYRFLQVVARAFTDERRRVLLIGDAAHLFAPFGARGMNSGFADAAAAADALAVALADPDDAGPAAIGHFATERRSAALANRDSAALALSAMQSRRPGMVLRRRVAAALAPRHERAGAWLDAAPYGPRLREQRRPGY